MDQTRLSRYSILEPLGESTTACGYCHSKPDSSVSYGVWAHSLSAKVYQLLIDRGWRRSGSYLYLPHLATTCCPPYPIRCSASGFRPSRSQRQAVSRWKAFVDPPHPSSSDPAPREKNPPPFDLAAIFNSLEAPRHDPSGQKAPKLEIKLEPAQFSKQKYELYKKYQMKVHDDSAEAVTEAGFKRFLCDHPFKAEAGAVAKHACWLLNGHTLLAFSVFDILPAGISSVYFVWDPDFARFGLGKLSVLREIAWIADWNSARFPPSFDWYYLGFYIHSCPKMRYKGDYSPSYLLDPSTREWAPLERSRPMLDGAVEGGVAARRAQPEAVGQEQAPADGHGGFLVQVLGQSGQIESVHSSCHSVRRLVQIFGKDVLRDSLICI